MKQVCRTKSQDALCGWNQRRFTTRSASTNLWSLINARMELAAYRDSPSSYMMYNRICCQSRRYLVSTTSGNFGDLPWKDLSKQRSGSSSPPVAANPSTTNSSSSNNNNNGSQLLDEAAAESQRISEKLLLSSALNVAVMSTSGTLDCDNEEVLLEKMRSLEEDADGLLAATRVTIPLAQMIIHSPDDGRVHLLHRAFLNIIQKCVSALIENSKIPSRHERAVPVRSKQKKPAALLSLDPPLLDKTLRLVVRAREDLGLFLHLPLYRLLATSVAQSSNSNATITKWTLQSARWAQEHFGPSSLTSEFFERPLECLAKRRRFTSMVEILLLVIHSKEFTVEHLEETALKRILHILYEDIRKHVWEPHPVTARRRHSKRKPTITAPVKEHDEAFILEELVMLLEPSIWKVFGYSSAIPEHASSLRDAVEVLLSTRDPSQPQQSSQDISNVPMTEDMIQAFFPNEHNTDNQTDEFDEYEEYDEEEETNHRSSNSIPPGRWEFFVDTAKDLSIVGVTRIFPDDDEEEDGEDEDDGWSTAVPDQQSLWQREDELPDIVQQLETATGKKLKYNKSMRQEILRSLGLGR